MFPHSILLIFNRIYTIIKKNKQVSLLFQEGKNDWEHDNLAATMIKADFPLMV